MIKRLPVTVVTGFLGSGKTTLLRHLLNHGEQRLAVMINEFGSVGLDGDLIRSCGFCSEEELEGRLVELTNGCLCCTVQEDFLRIEKGWPPRCRRGGKGGGPTPLPPPRASQARQNRAH